MEKEKHELEVVHGIEKVNSNTLSHVKGGISDPAEEKCCDIQFSCNNKGGKGTTKGNLGGGSVTLSALNILKE